MQALAVGVHVGYRAFGHTAVGRRLGHGRGDFYHQSRVKRLGDQILGTKHQWLAGIGGGDHFALLGLRQFSNRVNRSNFHFFRDGRRPTIQGTPKNVRKAQHVVDLVGVIGTPGRHDRVVTHRLDVGRVDFGVRVGQRKNQWIGGHRLDHVLLEHTTC